MHTEISIVITSKSVVGVRWTENQNDNDLKTRAHTVNAVPMDVTT